MTILDKIPKELYPFDSHFLEEDALRYHYLDEGQGPAVVMVHGNPSWSFYYRNLVRSLRATHRCVVPDHIGCGLSDKPGDDEYAYTIEQRVADLGALIDHLNLQDITLVVHDWGGMIGMTWAVQNPERIKRLVILNTAAFHLPTTKRLPASLWLVRNTGLGALLVRGFNAFSLGATRMAMARTKMPKDVRDAYVAPYDSWANRIATLRFVQDIPLKPADKGYDLIDRTQTALADGLFADIPTLICWGEKDFVFDDHFLTVWRTLMPHADIHPFAECGHYILEDASDEVIGLIRGFLGLEGG